MGSHISSFGASLVRRQIIDYQNNQGNGLFAFDANITANPKQPCGWSGDGTAGFLLGSYASVSQDLQLVWAGIRVLEFGSYVADDWKVNKRLTLNLGLRLNVPPATGRGGLIVL